MLLYQWLFFSAYKNEPKGFQDVKWGQGKEEFKGLEFVRHSSTWEGTDFYTRRGDRLKFGNIKVLSIEYCFWKNKLFAVKIYADGYRKFLKIKTTLENKYGPASVPDPEADYYLWLGDITVIELMFNAREGDIKEPFNLWFFSQEIHKEHDAWLKKQANQSPLTNPSQATEPSNTSSTAPDPQPAPEPSKPTAVKILTCEVEPQNGTEGELKGLIIGITVICTYEHPYNAIVGADLSVSFYDRFQDYVSSADYKTNFQCTRSTCLAFAYLNLKPYDDNHEFYEVLRELGAGRLLVEAKLQRLVLDDGTIINPHNYPPIDTWRNFTPKQ